MKLDILFAIDFPQKCPIGKRSSVKGQTASYCNRIGKERKSHFQFSPAAIRLFAQIPDRSLCQKWTGLSCARNTGRDYEVPHSDIGRGSLTAAAAVAFSVRWKSIREREPLSFSSLLRSAALLLFTHKKQMQKERERERELIIWITCSSFLKFLFYSRNVTMFLH